MNIFRLIVALVFLVIGLAIGVMNTDPILLKLPFIAQVQTSSGVAIILSLLAGVLIGGAIVLATIVWPLYAKLRKANKQVGTQASGTAS
jgi:uncharacterized integral membrane protein